MVSHDAAQVLFTEWCVPKVFTEWCVPAFSWQGTYTTHTHTVDAPVLFSTLLSPPLRPCTSTAQHTDLRPHVVRTEGRLSQARHQVQGGGGGVVAQAQERAHHGLHGLPAQHRPQPASSRCVCVCVVRSRLDLSD